MNKIYQGDCLDKLSQLEQNSVDLVVTSPPYNVGVNYDEYDDDLDKTEYSKFIGDVFHKLNRVVKPSGRVCVNISLGNEQSIVDKPSVVKMHGSNRWNLRFEIIWDKGNSEASSAWGSWRSPSSPRPIFNHEYIFVYDVGEESKNSEKTISKERFMELVKSVWSIKPKTNSEHPAAFPKEIPRRLIELNSYEGDVVLDPFTGSGTTLVAAEEMGRDYIGIELSNEYIKMAKERLNSEQAQDGNGKGVFDY